MIAVVVLSIPLHFQIGTYIFFSSIEFTLKFFSNDTWLYEVSSCLKVDHLKADKKKLIKNRVHGKDFIVSFILWGLFEIEWINFDLNIFIHVRFS